MSNIYNASNGKKTLDWTINTDSLELDLKGCNIAGIAFPEAYTNATLALEISFDNGSTWLPVEANDGTAVTFAPTKACYQYLPPFDSYGSFYSLRLKGSGNETSARTLTVVFTPLAIG